MPGLRIASADPVPALGAEPRSHYQWRAECLRRVRLGRTQSEHIESASPTTADIVRTCQQVRDAPGADLSERRRELALHWASGATSALRIFTGIRGCNMNPIHKKTKSRRKLYWVAGTLAAFAAGAWAVRAAGAEGAAKFLEAIAHIINALIWPAAILYLLIRFAPAIGNFIANSIDEFTFKGGGIEASLKRRQEQATEALTAAAISRTIKAAIENAQKSGGDHATAPGANGSIALPPAALEQAVKAQVEAVHLPRGLSRRAIHQIEGSNVLWVDDKPENNKFERQSLEAFGVKFVISTSTEDALDKVKKQKFDTIISDMGRPPDPRAGYTLLDQLRASGDRTPYIIYAGSRSPEHQMEARRRGALGTTNMPTELFHLVLLALREPDTF